MAPFKALAIMVCQLAPGSSKNVTVKIMAHLSVTSIQIALYFDNQFPLSHSRTAHVYCAAESTEEAGSIKCPECLAESRRTAQSQPEVIKYLTIIIEKDQIECGLSSELS